jgi:DNA-binding transcriptional regulator GbsR (MarR family)
MKESKAIKREFVEDAGKVFEKFGLTPMQGRLVAFLSFCEPPEKTFDELVRYFKASKSSISNSLNFLLLNKIIDYKTYAADRKRYFFLTDLFFRVYFQNVLENITVFREHAFKTLSLRSADHPEANTRILRWIENANLFEENIEKVIGQINRETE